MKGESIQWLSPFILFIPEPQSQPEYNAYQECGFLYLISHSMPGHPGHRPLYHDRAMPCESCPYAACHPLLRDMQSNRGSRDSSKLCKT
eukprot:207981-Rhodomonas_salina.4